MGFEANVSGIASALPAARSPSQIITKKKDKYEPTNFTSKRQQENEEREDVQEVPLSLTDHLAHTVPDNRRTSSNLLLRMSTIENTLWIENLYQNFKENLNLGIWNACEAAIADARKNGFTKEADLMRIELNYDRFIDR